MVFSEFNLVFLYLISPLSELNDLQQVNTFLIVLTAECRVPVVW